MSRIRAYSITVSWPPKVTNLKCYDRLQASFNISTLRTTTIAPFRVSFRKIPLLRASLIRAMRMRKVFHLWPLHIQLPRVLVAL